MQKTRYLELIDTNTPGNRYDVTPIFSDPRAFASLIDDLAFQCRDLEFDVIAGIDALGFILSSALSIKLGKSLVPIRKGGKLPVSVDSEYFVDYSGIEKSLEIRKDALIKSNSALIVDEWIETGSQVRAAANLIEHQGARVAGIISIGLDNCNGVKSLRQRYPMFSLFEDL
ncbi:MAG: adenine phosphoribosyltransferase [Chloroflexota bacterium]|nr:MAG: adenine phosphoribosyltransferase [Chloroflexota bacterium]